MAIITDLRVHREKEDARQRRIEENQQMLEEMSSEPTLTADEARRRSAASTLGKEIANNNHQDKYEIRFENGDAIEPDVVIRELTASALSAQTISAAMLCTMPSQAIAPFDWSNRIKACDESIIPFKYPVIRFTEEVPIGFAGPIAIRAKSEQPDDPDIFLYYRKRYLFMSQWDFCLFMAGTKKFHSFYGPMLGCEDELVKHVLINKLMKELRKTETFNFGAVKRSRFIQETLSKSTYVGDHVGFHLLTQIAIMDKLQTEFTML